MRRSQNRQKRRRWSRMKLIPFGIIISNVMIGSACITKGIV